MLSAFINGLLVSSTLLVAIGPQNAFVLRQGLKRESVFAIVMVSWLCDAALIALGTFKLGRILSENEVLLRYSLWAGIVVLILSAMYFFASALGIRRKVGRSRGLTVQNVTESKSTLTNRSPILAALAYSLCNPNVYLDTVVLLGLIGASYQGTSSWAFGGGAIAMSGLWFLVLGYGGVRLSRHLQTNLSWRILDGLFCLMMLYLAGGLIGRL